MSSQFTINEIAIHYGLQNQLVKTMEETGELQTAIAKFLLASTPEQAEELKSHVIEEAADCYIMVMQLRKLLSTYEFDKMVTFKLDRQKSGWSKSNEQGMQAMWATTARQRAYDLCKQAHRTYYRKARELLQSVQKNSAG